MGSVIRVGGKQPLTKTKRFKKKSRKVRRTLSKERWLMSPDRDAKATGVGWREPPARAGGRSAAFTARRDHDEACPKCLLPIVAGERVHYVGEDTLTHSRHVKTAEQPVPTCQRCWLQHQGECDR